MKAAIFEGKHRVVIKEVVCPRPCPDEVLIKVRACGICGTDVHIYEGDEGAAKSPKGTILGHEFAGEIADVGENIHWLHIGDRVSVDPNRMCGICDYCRGGLGHFCKAMEGIGTTRDGGFAEYCCVPAEQVYLISEKTSYLQAAMAEPAACCLHGIDMCEINAGDTVAVIGAGMIGLLMLQLARLRGAAKVIVIEPVEAKRKAALKMGAALVIDPFAAEVQIQLVLHGIERIQVVIECAGRVETIQQAVEIAGKKSVVMMFGLTKPDDMITLKPFEVFKKEIVLKASYINPYTQKRALDLIEAGELDVEEMIYERCSLIELPCILEDDKRRSQGKFVILFE